jgi:formate hydrogenlyase subunit 3/multisubunit Na+/H+ antiporter MnhD subunit
MKWVLIILAVLLFLMGTVWILQGTGSFPVGFMANDLRYTYAGIGLDLLAVFLFVLAIRRRR